MEDRTRNVRIRSRWDSPQAILDAVADQYHEDMWETQAFRPEVWIEKDALVGVIQGVCERHDVPYFSCRGYTSQSEMWGAAQRLDRSMIEGNIPVIIHLGDHDPSGIDMSRDIEDRLTMFLRTPAYEDWQFRRIALTMDQINDLNPPPNPAKVTDARFAKYEEEYGDESWELDALDPTYLDNLIEDEIATLTDSDQWAKNVERISLRKTRLHELATNWEDADEPD